MNRVDAVAKKVLGELIRDARATAADIAPRIGATPEAVQARIDRLVSEGVLRGFSVHVSAEKLGRPHEMLVTGAPSAVTTRAALEALCSEDGVTRVFTLAHQNAVAFTYRGRDIEEMHHCAATLAERSGLQEPQMTLIVDTLLDDASHGIKHTITT